MIHMVVSTGAQEPDPVPVPNVVNTIQTEAENQLRAKGLIPEVVVDNHDSYAAGWCSSRSRQRTPNCSREAR